MLRFPRAPFTLRRWLVAADAFDLVDNDAALAIYQVHTNLIELKVPHKKNFGYKWMSSLSL